MVISIITHSQITIQPANLNGAGKSVEITLTAKTDLIKASYSISESGQMIDWIYFKFSGNTRSQIMLENVLVSSIVNKETGMSTTLNAAGKNKFTIPNNLPAGSYDFLLNGKLIAINYKVQ